MELTTPALIQNWSLHTHSYPEPIASHTQLSRTHRYTHTVIQSLLIQSPSLHRQLFRAHHYTYTHTHTHSYPQPITSHTVIHSPSLHTQSYPEPITTQRERESWPEPVTWHSQLSEPITSHTQLSRHIFHTHRIQDSLGSVAWKLECAMPALPHKTQCRHYP